MHPSLELGSSLASTEIEGNVKHPIGQNNKKSGEVLVAPSEHSISDASTSRVAAGPLHSFNPSPCAGTASSGIDVASSEVSLHARYNPSCSVALDSNALLIFTISIFVGRKCGRTRGC